MAFCFLECVLQSSWACSRILLFAQRARAACAAAVGVVPFVHCAAPSRRALAARARLWLAFTRYWAEFRSDSRPKAMVESVRYDSVFDSGVPAAFRATVSLEIISDVMLFAAYAAISVQLFLHSRAALSMIKSVDTNGPIAQGSLLFQLFVGACGVTHLGMGLSNAVLHTSAIMQVINMVLKFICACISCYTAIVLTPTLKLAVEALSKEHKRVIQLQERSEEAHIGVSVLSFHNAHNRKVKTDDMLVIMRFRFVSRSQSNCDTSRTRFGTRPTRCLRQRISYRCFTPPLQV